ncbi:MAG: hypothetical protein WBC04_23055 [Candidatus Acidiferrales bacterium]
MERLTGFRPARPLAQILDRVIEYFQKKKAGFIAAGDETAPSVDRSMKAGGAFS